MRLKPHGDALFAARKRLGNRILEIEQLSRMDLERLRTDLLAVNQDVKRAQPALASAISASQGHRFVRRYLQLVTEPPVTRLAKPAALIGAFALVIVVAFALSRACGHRINRASLNLLASSFVRGNFRFALFPFDCRVDSPVDGVTGLEDLIERKQR